MASKTSIKRQTAAMRRTLKKVERLVDYADHYQKEGDHGRAAIYLQHAQINLNVAVGIKLLADDEIEKYADEKMGKAV